MPESVGFHLCPTCWQIEKACKAEGVSSLAEIADPATGRAALLWRVSDIIRRSNVEDAEGLVRRLELEVR